MAKFKPICMLLVAFLVVSLGVNAYLWSQNQTITEQNTQATVGQDMVSQLMHTQNNINGELAKLDDALMTACTRLKSIGLTGTEADTLLSQLVENNSLIVNAATSNAKNVLVAVQPSSYGSIIGGDISSQEHTVQMQQTMRPAMSNVIKLVEGFPGVVMIVPIFDSQDKFMGALSIVIQPSMLINQSIVTNPDAKVYSMWAMQKNGTLIYDEGPEQGKNIFTDPDYQGYTELQSFIHQAVDTQSGYGTYSYYDDLQASRPLVSKDAYWTTIGIYNTDWRLVIARTL